jgi:hypothetical protein
MSRDPLVRGALVGWRRSDSDNGAVLRLQVARTSADFREHSYDRIEIALNDRQLRSFTRDMVRAAQDRHIRLFARRSLLNRLLGRR